MTDEEMVNTIPPLIPTNYFQPIQFKYIGDLTTDNPRLRNVASRNQPLASSIANPTSWPQFPPISNTELEQREAVFCKTLEIKTGND